MAVQNTENQDKKGGPSQPLSMFKIVNLSEVFDEMEARNERWKEERRFGRVSYNEEFKAIVFHFDETTAAERYWFSVSRFETHKGQMAWLNHLRRKTWFTADVLDDLFDVMERLGLLPPEGSI